MKLIHTFEHYRDCPVLRQTWSDLVDQTNKGDLEYGYEARRVEFHESERLEQELQILQSGTENCTGPQIAARGENVSIYCPGKDRAFSNEELVKMGYPVRLVLESIIP